MVIFDKDMRLLPDMGNAEVVVKSGFQRSWSDFPVVVYAFDVVPAGGSRSAVAEVPLPNQRSFVACVAQHFWESVLMVVDQHRVG